MAFAECRDARLLISGRRHGFRPRAGCRRTAAMTLIARRSGSGWPAENGVPMPRRATSRSTSGADDAGSLVFETAPLEEPLEIAGDAALDLASKATCPWRMVAVRLSDVAPDGQATRVTYGLLNLTHRESHERPEPAGTRPALHVRVPFKHVAQRFEAGQSDPASISTTYFPLAWPAPERGDAGHPPRRLPAGTSCRGTARGRGRRHAALRRRGMAPPLENVGARAGEGAGASPRIWATDTSPWRSSMTTAPSGSPKTTSPIASAVQERYWLHRRRLWLRLRRGVAGPTKCRVATGSRAA